VLLPGRIFCGDLVVAPIGISDATIAAVAPEIFRNDPVNWHAHMPVPDPKGHKYARGHALVFGGWPTSGAARLAARAALRAGAGLVSVAVAPEAFQVYAISLEAVMVKTLAGEGDLDTLLGDLRHNALLIGPGAGLGAQTLERALKVIAADRATVLDADALTVLAQAPERFHAAMAARRSGRAVVLTPHEGEFRRLFSVTGDKLSRVRAAARESGTVIVLKGADTAIAAPDGRTAINDNAPATLATAGSGDVLAGIILGLLAHGMPGFEAACAGVWLHGAAAAGFGPGLIAEDLPDRLPLALRQVR
jgi:NAD(P)H-hydrate epimerase